MIEIDGVTYIHIKEASKEINKTKASIWWWIQFQKKATKEQKENIPEFPEWVEHDGKFYIKAEEINKLKKFAEDIEYGDLSLNENEVDRNTHVTMSQASRIIGRTKVTVSRWYKWYEEMNEEQRKELPKLPKYEEDARGWKWIAKKDIPKLENFKNSIKKGHFSKFTRDL